MKGDRYPRYLLGLLMAILAFNYVDRIVLGVTLQNIKVDLHLSDTDLGFLSGIAFALFYAIAGLPIARWADRGNRVTIISLTAAIWSVAVALCGVAANFVQLLGVRVVVAVGEAGCVPPAHSLIADHFTRAERPRAAATYMLGVPLAMTIGYFAAGWLNELIGWRSTFIVIGLPGIVLAALARFTLREPRRAVLVARTQARASSAPPQSTLDAAAAVPGDAQLGLGGREPVAAPRQLSMWEVFATLWRNVTFRHLLLCFSVWYFFGYGMLQWQPTFFVRSFWLTTGELGVWLAIISGGGALLGTYLGGEWAARYAPNDERLQLIAVAVMFSVFAVFNVAAYLAPTVSIAFGAVGIAAIGGNMAQGPILATIQTLVPPPMRATALAILYLSANLIGMGLGPLAVGALSDALHPYAGKESLRYALVVFSPGYLWAAWHLMRASRTVARDLGIAPASGAPILSPIANR